MKKISVLWFVLLLILGMRSFAQNDGGVSIGKGSSPANQKSILELVSKTKGLLIPRMTDTERNAIFSGTDQTAKGLMVFDDTNNAFYFWDGSAWKAIASGNVMTVSGTPSTPGTTGELVFDTQNSLLYIYDGSKWLKVGANSTNNTNSALASEVKVLPNTTVGLSSENVQEALLELQDEIKTASGGGMNSVVHDPSLLGNGTDGIPLTIAPGGISGSHLKDAAVTAAKIGGGGNNKVLTTDGTGTTVWADKSSLGGSGGNSSSVITDKTLIGDGTASSPLGLKDGMVTASKISGGGSNKILATDGTGTAIWIEKSSLGGSDGNSSSVITDETLTGDGTALSRLGLASDAVTSDKIAFGAVTAAKIEDDAVNSSKIHDFAITTAKIEDGAVSTSKIAFGAATAEKIGYRAVTTEKIEEDAVTSSKILDGTIEAKDLGDMNAQDGYILQWKGGYGWLALPGNLGTGGGITKITPGTGLTGGGSTGDVTLSLADGGISTSKIADGAIQASKLGQMGATASGQVLQWDGSVWKPSTISGGTVSVSTDATLKGNGTASSPLGLANGAIQAANLASMGATASGQVLQWDGSVWKPATISVGTGSGTNLSASTTGTSMTINSSTGTSTAVIPIGSTSSAGLITAADKIKLDGITGTNTGDQDLTPYALKANVLERNNTVAFTPTGDYQPATKKYVDDQAGLGPVAPTTILGNKSGSLAAPAALTTTEVKTMLALTKTDVGLGNVDNTSDLAKPISTATQMALDGKVDKNANITAGTATKITYDSKGLVTAGVAATTADITSVTDKRYVTDAQLVVIGNTSGTNTGDQTAGGVAVTPKGTLTSTTVQAALEELQGEITTAASGGLTSVSTDATLTGNGNSTALGIADKAVTLTKMADLAAKSLIGNSTTAAAKPEAITIGTGLTLNGGILSAGGTAGATGGDVVISGQNYLTLSGQTLTAGAVDLSGTHVTGTLAAARFPALSGDVTTTAGSLVTSLSNIVTGGTATKVTYNNKGLVTAGAQATTADIASVADKRYVTDAQLAVIGNTSGSNTGDMAIGGQTYLTLSGQTLTAGPVDLSGTHATGILAPARFPALSGDVTTTAGSLVTSLNNIVTGGTATKITYNNKGLVTAGAQATTADIASVADKRYVTDAQLAVIGNTSGSNTGDQTLSMVGNTLSLTGGGSVTGIGDITSVVAGSGLTGGGTSGDVTLNLGTNAVGASALKGSSGALGNGGGNGFVLQSNGDGTFSWKDITSGVAADPSSLGLGTGQFFIGDASSKASAISKNLIPLSGFGAATATVDLGNNIISNVANPASATDAVNKTYVDAKVPTSAPGNSGQVLTVNGSGNPTWQSIPIGSNSTPSLMTAADKTKLDGIAANANNYALPIASAGTLGGIKVGSNLSIDGSGVLSATSGGLTAINASTLLGNNTGSSAVPTALDATAVRTLLSINNIDNTTDALKPVSTATQNALNLKQDVANLSSNVTTDAASTTKYPSVSAIKTYVDAQVSSGASSATTTSLGIIKLAGDLSGTALLPSVATVGGSTAAEVNTATLLANGATTASTANTIVKRDGSGNIPGNITGNAATATTATTATNIAGGNAGDIFYQSAAGTTAKLPKGTAGQVLTMNAGATSPIWAAAAGGGDMLLATTQSVTGTKTFDNSKLAMKGTSTGITTVSSANTTTSDYTLTFPASTGTVALSTSPLSQFAATTSAQLAGVISDETGNGSLVFATSPALVTPALGAATATSITASGNLSGSQLISTVTTGTAPFSVTSTTPVTNLSIGGNAATATNIAGGNAGDIFYQSAAGTTAKLPKGTAGQVLTMNAGATSPIWAAAAGGGDMLLATAQSVTGLKTFDNSKLAMKGTSTGITTVSSANTTTSDYTLTLPASTGTVALSTSPLSQFAATTSAQLAGVISDETGSGSLVFATSPTLVTPALGAATATSITATGNLSGSQLISTVTTGTAPFSVTSTTPVTNLSIGGTAAKATNIEGGAAGQILYQSAAGTTSKTAAGTLGQVLTSNGAGAPTWTNSGTGDMSKSTYDPAGINQQLVGTTATQTLTNKELTSPKITTPTGLVKSDVGLGNVQNVDQTNATNLTSGIVAAARLGTGTADATTFLAGDGTWKVAGGSSTTNLNYTAAPLKGTITSSTGTGTDIPEATTTNAGLLNNTDKTKLTKIPDITNAPAAGNVLTATSATSATWTTPVAGGGGGSPQIYFADVNHEALVKGWGDKLSYVRGSDYNLELSIPANSIPDYIRINITDHTVLNSIAETTGFLLTIKDLSTTPVWNTDVTTMLVPTISIITLGSNSSMIPTDSNTFDYHNGGTGLINIYKCANGELQLFVNSFPEFNNVASPFGYAVILTF